MFFSIVVPTYNPRKYITNLLDSICQNDCKDEIEVILSDDISTEPFDDIIDNYVHLLNIKIIQNNKHYGSPLGGRKNGADASTGNWICFADQDDIFIEHALDNVKDFILNDNIHNYIVSNIYQKDFDGKYHEDIHPLNLTHGKFYEKDFWNKYEIQYENVRYCEDINLSVTINCVLAELGINPVFYDSYTYVWQLRKDSLSNGNGYSEYFYKSFPDYIRGTLGNYIIRYKNIDHANPNVENWYLFNIASILMHLYFYFEGMKYKNNGCPDIPDEYYAIIRNNYIEFKTISGYDDNSFYNIIYNEYIDEYKHVREVVYSQIPFIETITFHDFITEINSALNSPHFFSS